MDVGYPEVTGYLAKNRHYTNNLVVSAIACFRQQSRFFSDQPLLFRRIISGLSLGLIGNASGKVRCEVP